MRTLSSLVGHSHARESLAVYISAALQRGDPLPHVLLTGPAGVGKRTLVEGIAKELGSPVRNGTATGRPGDLGGWLTNLQPRDILLIQEVHKISPAFERILVPAMREYRLDIEIGEGVSARTMKIDLPGFTLIGSSTKPGSLPDELQATFGISLRLEPLPPEDLARIVMGAAAERNIRIAPGTASEIVAVATGLPRSALALLERLRDFAQVAGKLEIDVATARAGLGKIVDPRSLAGGSNREPIPEGVRTYVWRRDEGKCVSCGSNSRLEFDHIIPVIEGGSNTERNVQLLCEACNRSKGAMI